MPEPTIRTITQAKALAALANPYRSRILDALRVDGPSTASTLAERTGQAVGSASHHLKVLAEAGFIVEAPELAKDRRERWWRTATDGYRWESGGLDEEAKEVGRAAELLQLERQADRSRAWLDNAATAPEWEATAFATQYWFRLTPEELGELSEELLAVLRRWQQRDLDRRQVRADRHQQTDRADQQPADAAEEADRVEPVLFFARGFPSQP